MFKLLRIPEMINSLLSDLEMLFTVPQWVHLQTMLLSLVITPFKPTVVGRDRVIGFGPHRTKRNEFLQNHDAILCKALRLYALKLIALLGRSREPLYIILDDTKAAKRGKHIQAAWHMFDHVTKRFIWGHQFVCMTLVYRHMTIPYAMELYRSKDDCKKRGLPFRKLTAIAEDLIRAVPDFGIPRVYVLADTYYASKRIIACVRSKGFHCISVLKSNRCIALKGRRTTIQKFIKRHFAHRRKRHVAAGSARFATVLQPCHLPGVGSVTIVCSQKRGRHAILTLVSTDTSLNASQVITIYRVRWSIEVLFKHAKQYLGLTAYHHRDERAVRTHLQLVLLAYCLLTHLFLAELRAQGKPFTPKRLATFAIRESQVHLRSLVTLETLDCIKEHVHHSKENLFEEIKTHLLAA